MSCARSALALPAVLHARPFKLRLTPPIPQALVGGASICCVGRAFRATKWEPPGVRADLGVKGVAGERLRIWPIVRISDWGEPVPVEQIDDVLRHGVRAPATGVMVFAWSGLRAHPPKIDAIGRASRSMAGPE